MGLLNFVKEAGEKIWDAVSGDSKEDRADKLKKHIDGLNLPGAEKVNIDVAEDGTATVTGDVASQEDKEKILVAVGNVTGVGQVSDGVKVTQSGAESRFYTVKSGDTLSAISKAMYGSANEYQRIFEANKPMLTHPDKIYPGEVGHSTATSAMAGILALYRCRKPPRTSILLSTAKEPASWLFVPPGSGAYCASASASRASSCSVILRCCSSSSAPR